MYGALFSQSYFAASVTCVTSVLNVQEFSALSERLFFFFFLASSLLSCFQSVKCCVSVQPLSIDPSSTCMKLTGSHQPRDSCKLSPAVLFHQLSCSLHFSLTQNMSEYTLPLEGVVRLPCFHCYYNSYLLWAPSSSSCCSYCFSFSFG